MRKRTTRVVAGAALVAAAAATAYPVPVRRWWLTWGAGRTEIARPMPGDDLLPDADSVSTRATTIDASAAAVWPYLVRMISRARTYPYGPVGRARGTGWTPPVGVDLHVGDLVKVGPHRSTLRCVVMRDEERTIVLRTDDGRRVWTLGIYPDGGMSRLVSRVRIADADATAARRLVGRTVAEFASLVAECRLLRGIKQRAETLDLIAPRTPAWPKPILVGAGQP